MHLNFQLYSILERYIDSFYDLCISAKEEKLFFDEINKETEKMGVGPFYQ